MTSITFATAPVAPSVAMVGYVLYGGSLKKVDANTPVKDIVRELVSRGSVSLSVVKNINEGSTWQEVRDVSNPTLSLSQMGFAVLDNGEIPNETVEIRVVVKGS